ncbi:MFS transporter [Spirillospora albida]|uniref:MFS transporter n=1 Tax=Spirillospora albida TaxID=58123 RepID=UPI0004C216F4|nr:MFS transporter [Spirillospora albida]
MATTVTAPAVSARRAWTTVALLVLFMMINFLDKAVLGLAGDDIRRDLRLSGTEFGSVGTAFFLLFSVAGIAAGFVADRVGTRRLLAVLVVLWSASQLVAALPAAGLGTLLITRVVLGAAEGPSFAMATHTAFGWFPDRERALPGSLLSVGAAAGVVLGAPALAAVISRYGWRTAFAVTGVLGVLWLAAWLPLGGEGPHAPGAAGTRGEPRVPYRRLLTRGTVLGALAAGFAAFWTMAVAITWLPQFLQRVHGMTLETASVIAAGTQVVGIGVMLGVGYASTRLTRAGRSTRTARGVLGGACVVVSGVGCLLVPRSGGGAALVLVMMVAFTAGNAFFALMQAVIAELAPTRQRAALLGTVTALASTAGAVGPLLSGAIVDAASTEPTGFRHVFDLAATLMIIGGLLAAALIRPARDRASLPPNDL